MEDYLKQNCKFKPLRTGMAETTQPFSCGDSDLDGFFHEDFRPYEDELMGKSYCFVKKDEQKTIVAAFTVCNASIHNRLLTSSAKKHLSENVSEEPTEQREQKPKPFGLSRVAKEEDEVNHTSNRVDKTKKHTTMARPIRNTPIPFGEDATEFLRQTSTPIPLEERRRMRREVDQGAARLTEPAAKLPKRKAVEA